jgi:hypothetical protein
MPMNNEPPIGGDRRASAAIRGARTMGYGRPGVDVNALEALMFSEAPAEGSVMPNGISRDAAERMLAESRMQAMLEAIRQSQRIPSVETR